MITTRQYMWFFLAFFFEADLLSRPTIPARLAGPDVWLAAILPLPMILVVQLLVLSVARRYPDRTLPQFLPDALGPLLGRLILALFTLFFLAESVKATLGLSRTTQMFLLPRTPMRVTTLVILVLAGYLARHGLGPLVRYIELTIPVLTLIFLLIIAGATKDADLNHLMPVLSHGWGRVFAAAGYSLSRAVGLELLFFLFPFLEHRERVFGPAAVVILARVAIFTYLNVMTVAVLGLRETVHQIWPVIGVIKSVELAGFGFERLDPFFNAAWIMASFNVIAARLFLTAYAITQLLGARTHKFAVWAVIPVVYLGTRIPNSPLMFEGFVEYLVVLSAAVLLGVPVLLWLACLLRGRRKLDVHG